MFKRKSSIFLFYLAVHILFLCLMFAHAAFKKKGDALFLQERKEMIKRLELTDLCLFTDARYARHPSMADLNTPFQDYPLSFEHFPSGSLISVPPTLKVNTDTRDGLD